VNNYAVTINKFKP